MKKCVARAELYALTGRCTGNEPALLPTKTNELV